ncbi:hypothetical protein [Streptomyces zagrosensis]|uniref:Uncharacterized protein n=1 Tax=Streptomyces zagrosensis TaxID=1042984 RepID=A0A7W9Q617_9ACTN|nr:hypothetical protein [Streptomyces zagrosensis]MBB5934294.1 hypothetical protein [Streptomyces zagrosensis]
MGLLNLSGLGVGYALTRVWWAMALCWAATGGLLLLTLPADPDGVSGGVLVGYLAVLAGAAAHGAYLGLRRRLTWPPRSTVAVLLGVVLLAAPGGGFVAYDSARDEATQEMLLDRLERADRIVETANDQPFSRAESDYTKALDIYGDLTDDHAGSRAAKRVPDRLQTYYETVGAPYGRKEYCEAITPLKHLRTVPAIVGKQSVGPLATWPDDRLATSLYECGVTGLGQSVYAAEKNANLSELLTEFPKSEQAAKVEPAVSAAIATAADNLKGSAPCEAVTTLNALSSQATVLAKGATGGAGGLGEAAGTAKGHVQSGTYACGVDQYKDGQFDSAIKTLKGFADTYRSDKNRPRAQKIVIAAEIAKELPAAGKNLPTTASGGSITVTVKNDSPNPVDILYTGPVTGSFSLKACDGCTTYSNRAAARRSACQGSKSYPQRTISLPVGTSYFLHKSTGGSSNSSGADTAKIEPGYIYTECAYAVSPFGLDVAD